MIINNLYFILNIKYFKYFKIKYKFKFSEIRFVEY